MNFSLYAPTEIYSGKGCVLTFDRFSMFGSRCAVITGKNMFKHNSALSDTQIALSNNKIEYIIINEAENNPSVKSVFAISTIVKSFNADFIIGIGGGSAMDTAKAVAIAVTNNDLNENNFFSLKSDASSLPVILIGTTAGTGSEVMPSAVLTVDGEIRIKKSIKTHNSYAKVALCDFSYSASMSDELTVSTALDTVCHAIEAIFSKKGGEWSRIYGLCALNHSFQSIVEFVNGNHDDKLREKLYFGSLLGGLAINNGGTSFPHSMGYMLTTMHGISHGFACALFIKEFLLRVSRIRDISDTLSACGVSALNEFIDYVDILLDKYNVKINIKKDALMQYATIAMSMNVNNNYLNLSFDDCFEIYLSTCHDSEGAGE